MLFNIKKIIVAIACSFPLSVWSVDFSDFEKTVLSFDSLLFSAFNQGDVQSMSLLIDGDLEFYHDKAGLSDFDRFVSSIHKMREAGGKITRSLITEGQEIYRIPEYGAMHSGKHRFCQGGVESDSCGEFKFMHLWRNDSGIWRLHRVISYAH